MSDTSRKEGDPIDVPDLLNVGAIPSNYAAEIDTDILEPVVHTDNFVRYQLVNKGFLNPYSRITFGLTYDKTANPDERSFLPLGVGVNSLVRRATLKIGNKTICEVDDFNHFQAYRSLFISNEAQKEREQYLSGRTISHRQSIDSDTGEKSLRSKFIEIDNGKEYLEVNGIDSNLLLRDEVLMTNQPVFSITLEELFPLFHGSQFPLYVLNQDMPVQIELTMSDSTERVCVNASDTAGVSYTLDRNQSRMIADYTTYEGNVMEAWARKNSQLMFSYMDYRLTRQTIDVDTASDINQGIDNIRNVGGAGRLVSKIFVGTSANDQTGTSLLNVYDSEAPAITGTTFNELTANVKKNDTFIYPIDRKNISLHYQAIVDTEKLPPFVSRDEYSRQGNIISSVARVEQNLQPLNLRGRFFWTCYKLPDAARVNSRGIELSTSQQLPDTTTYTARAWIEIVKSFVMDNGAADCYYA